MERWRKILRHWGPRGDIDGEFYPDRTEVEKPVLLNKMGPVAAGFVAARVLRAVVGRGGSLVKPSAVEKLEDLLSRGLSEDVVHHCEAEAERILEWIERRPVADETDGRRASGESDFDVMMSADVESRLSVADFALEEDYDLELEYFDEETGRWPRISARLLEIRDREAADFETALRLKDRQGRFEVSLKHVRWLMPIPEVPWSRQPESEGGEVLEFPGGFDES